jgi:hypothetical protein
MKRLWIALPILLAMMLAIVLIPQATPSSFEAARARWDARPFTNYRMTARYYPNSGNCMQELSVEGDVVIEVLNATTCNTPLPELVEYPTITDILNYIQRHNEEFEANSICTSEECRCDIPMGAVTRYDILGYPRYAEVRPIWEMRRRPGVFAPISACNSFGYEWSSIEIVRVIPE